jgi:sporulation protein YlmC with PRC-barrel domain
MFIMLHKVKTLSGYNLHSLDGEIGNVEEFYFDDHHWTIRYLVANTGSWLTGRQVLISPYALAAVNKEAQYIAIDLTKKQIEDSPALDSDKPVSLQFEESYNKYYGWPMYWSGPCMWGTYPYILRDPKMWSESSTNEKSWNPHLRSTSAVSGYNIDAADGEIGHVEDFIIDDETWAIRYLVIDTQNWWPGGKAVVISPQWIERVSWDLSKVFVNLSYDAIKNAPEYTTETLLNRDYETKLYNHYNRHGYWANDITTKKPSR